MQMLDDKSEHTNIKPQEHLRVQTPHKAMQDDSKSHLYREPKIQGHIYFEEDHQGNCAEAFYKTLSEAMDEFHGSVHLFREKE